MAEEKWCRESQQRGSGREGVAALLRVREVGISGMRGVEEDVLNVKGWR